ncbi:hypothetical protein [Amycolatopsis tolypomycina]|uniref:hypothetical protein n=1 Tax=Amycolatopsis tolypomycina TaxID=208445 RepID=UPI0033B401FC
MVLTRTGDELVVGVGAGGGAWWVLVVIWCVTTWCWCRQVTSPWRPPAAGCRLVVAVGVVVFSASASASASTSASTSTSASASASAGGLVLVAFGW